MKTLIKILLREGLESNVQPDHDFEYKGYECKVPYIKHRNAYGSQVYKNDKYLWGLKGWLPLEKAIAWAKHVVDHS